MLMACYFAVSSRCTRLYLGVSKNWGPPKSSILIGVFHYFHHPFWGKNSIFGNLHFHMNKVGFRNFPGFRNLDSETFSLDSETFSLDSETFSLDSETFSLDSETLSSETFWADSETLFVGFRNFFRWIQKLFSLDSETFFVGFRNFFRWIQTLFALDSETFSLDSETFFVGFRNFFRWIQKLFSLDSETFFVGFRNFFRWIQKLFSVDSPPQHMVDATQDLGQGSGGVGWDDNVLWPCAHGRCDTRPEAGVGWGGVGCGMITFFWP